MLASYFTMVYLSKLRNQHWCITVQFKTVWILAFFFLNFSEVYLLYNVVLVSAVRQSESAIHVHVSPLFLDFLPTIEGQVPSTHHRPLSRVPCTIQ